VTNNDVNPQDFSLLMSLPVSPAIPNPLISGSIQGTLTNLAATGGATVSAVPGSSIYTAFIDGSVEHLLMTDPFATTVTGPFVSGPVGPQSFGTPVPIAGSQSVDSSIAILLNFRLSPGDSASFTSIFNVEVPAPASLPLLAGLGLFAGGRRRR